jgi:hypothetical protein
MRLVGSSIGVCGTLIGDRYLFYLHTVYLILPTRLSFESKSIGKMMPALFVSVICQAS